MKNMNPEMNLKIYWVVTIWPKGQVIIPKDARDDFDIKESLQQNIAVIDRKGFAIWTKQNIEIECSIDHKLVEQEGTIKIGTKFQFVIPSSVRNKLEIWPKDNLLVIWKWCVWIGFIKNDKIEYVLNYIKENSQQKKSDS